MTITRPDKGPKVSPILLPCPIQYSPAHLQLPTWSGVTYLAWPHPSSTSRFPQTRLTAFVVLLHHFASFPPFPVATGLFFSSSSALFLIPQHFSLPAWAPQAGLLSSCLLAVLSLQKRKYSRHPVVASNPAEQRFSSSGGKLPFLLLFMGPTYR